MFGVELHLTRLRIPHSRIPHRRNNWWALSENRPPFSEPLVRTPGLEFEAIWHGPKLGVVRQGFEFLHFRRQKNLHWFPVIAFSFRIHDRMSFNFRSSTVGILHGLSSQHTFPRASRWNLGSGILSIPWRLPFGQKLRGTERCNPRLLGTDLPLRHVNNARLVL
jgi:hypothetical protein